MTKLQRKEKRLHKKLDRYQRKLNKWLKKGKMNKFLKKYDIINVLT